VVVKAANSQFGKLVYLVHVHGREENKQLGAAFMNLRIGYGTLRRAHKDAGEVKLPIFMKAAQVSKTPSLGLKTA
jgi:hypothetical protein